MAISLVATANVTNTTSGTSVVVNKPTGTVSGNVLVAAVYATGAQTITPPSGWTLQASETGSSSNRVWMYTKVAGGAEPSNYTWTLSSGSKNAGWIGAYAGVNATPLDAATNGTFASTTATMSTSLTIASTSSVMFIAALGRHAFGAAQSMTSSDGTDTADFTSNTSTGSGSDLSCYVFRSVALSMGAATRTLTASATQQTFDYAAISLAAATPAAVTGRVYRAGLEAPTVGPSPSGRVYRAGMSVSAGVASKTARLYTAGLTAPIPAGGAAGSGIFVARAGNLQEIALYVCANGQVQ